MESYVAVAETARKKAGVADHILTQTYPMVKDPKLLVAVLQNAFESVEAGIDALLLLERERKRIPPVAGDFTARFAGFTRHVAPLYELPDGFLRFVAELLETVREHKRSPVEFVRKQQYVICDDTYRLRTLNEEQLKKYVQRAKAFAALVEEKVTGHDAIPA